MGAQTPRSRCGRLSLAACARCPHQRIASSPSCANVILVDILVEHTVGSAVRSGCGRCSSGRIRVDCDRQRPQATAAATGTGQGASHSRPGGACSTALLGAFRDFVDCRSARRRVWTRKGSLTRRVCLYAGALLCLLVSSAVTMAVPYSVGAMIDLVANQQGDGGERLASLIQLLLGAFVVGGLANFGRLLLMQSAGAAQPPRVPTRRAHPRPGRASHHRTSSSAAVLAVHASRSGVLRRQQIRRVGKQVADDVCGSFSGA
jgi:hypothetical protein